MKKTATPKCLVRASLFTLVALLLAPMVVRAQVARYGFSPGTGPYVPITGGTVLATGTPSVPPGPFSLSGTVYDLGPGAIPFAFRFNGAAYTSCYVASGGYLTLGPVAPFPRFTQKPGSTNFYDIDHPLSEPDGTNYDGVIAAMAGDVLANVNPPAPLGEIRYQTLGTAPNRVFVVQWSRMRGYASVASDLNFQVRLHEGSSLIDLAYGLCQSDRALNVQVGLRGFTPNDWNNRTGSWAASSAGAANTDALAVGPSSAPVAGLLYSFIPPTPQPCPVPFSLTATPGGTQARLSWRALAPSAGPYNVVYGLAGFNPATGGLGTVNNVAGTSTTITGLVPSTNYEFYVTQLCGGSSGTSPASSPPGRFRTTILNDEAVDAVPLPVTATCQPVSSTGQGATPSQSNGYNPLIDCNGFSPSPAAADVWFSLTTAASGPASTAMQITATGSTAFRVRVLSSAAGSAGPFTQLYCAVNSTFGQVFAPFVLTGLSPSTTYYLLVTAADAFTMCATIPSPCGSPTNLTALVANSTATTAQLSFMPGSGAIDYTITLTPPGGPTQTVSPRPTGSPITLSGLTPATSYAGTLQANCSNGGVSTTVPFTAYTRPVNDAIADAIGLPITAACQPVAGSTQNALGTVPVLNPPVSCGDRIPFDVWYSFTTPATGPASRAVRIQVSGVGAQQLRIFSGAIGSFQQVACSGTSSAAPAPQLDLINLSPGTTYYIQVGNYARPAVQGPFTICVTEPPTCGAPQGVAVNNITATSANLSYTAGLPTATAGYSVTLTPQGGPVTTFTNAGTGGSIPLPGLVPGTYYTVALQANCGVGGLSLPATARFRTPGPPSNDLCAAAIPIVCGDGPFTGMVAGATAAGDPSTACGGLAPLGPGVWYRFAGSGQTVTLTFCSGFGDDPDLQLLVYSGSCGALQCVGSNDDSNACSLPRLPTYTFATTAGQDYYALVVATGRFQLPASSGEFDMFVSCAGATACPAPTALALTQVTSGAATVSWTPVAGASAYEVVWQPLSGATQPIVTPAMASPASTSLLRPNTPYLVTVSAICGSSRQRSVGATAQFTTLLGVRNAALAAQVELYPNPAHATTILQVPAALRAAPLPLVLYNALGQAVRQRTLPTGTGTATLDLQGLPPGRYLLQLQGAPGLVSKDLIIE